MGSSNDGHEKIQRLNKTRSIKLTDGCMKLVAKKPKLNWSRNSSSDDIDIWFENGQVNKKVKLDIITVVVVKLGFGVSLLYY